MKLGNDVLVALVEAFRKAITDNVDISDLLRQLDLTPSDDGKTLDLKTDLKDVFNRQSTDWKF